MDTRIVSALSLMFLWAAVTSCGAAQPPAPDFTREVRPLLSRHCFKCHGPDDLTRKSGLRLDVRDAALRPAKSGAIALVPGNPEQSELVKRLFTGDPDEIMPPPATKNPLTDSEKDILKRWVKAGGEYRDHWAYVVPQKAPLPKVKNRGWAKNAIDAFVLETLEKQGLSPSAPADRYTLVRRVYLDLVGLPPTLEEADAFVNDRASDAYERLVDRLLASPNYGERWGRRWLDLARYADTNGYEKDRQRSIWPYRDWVIQALNADMPFDQFTIEQIAGDLLPNATLDQQIATGFHRNTMLNEEGGIDPLEFRFHAMTDRVATTGVAWLGLTLGCAQCHTHKYDPIPQKEYYQIMAFLNNADEPDLDLPKPEALVKHRADLEKAAALLVDLPNRFPVEGEKWEISKPIRVQADSGESPKNLPDGSLLFAAKSPDKDVFTLEFGTELMEVDGLRLEALTDESLPSKGPGRVAHGNFVLTEIKIQTASNPTPGGAQPVTIARGRADVEQTGFPLSNAFDGNSATGWAVDADKKTLNATHTAIFDFATPVKPAAGTRFVVRLEQAYGGQHVLGRFRISLRGPLPDARPVAERRKELLEHRFAEWLSKGRRDVVEWVPLRPVKMTSTKPLLTLQPDDSVFASGDITKADTYELDFREVPQGVTAIRLEAMPDDRLPHHGPGMAYYEGPKGDFFMGEFKLSVEEKQISFASATHSYARNNFGANASAAAAMDGDPQTGWSTAGREGERHEAVFVLKEPLNARGAMRTTLMFGRHYACSLGRFRISATTHPGGVQAQDEPEEIRALLRIPDTQLSENERKQLYERFLLTAPELASARKEIETLRKPPVHPITMVMRERPPENTRPTFIHKRGEFLQPGEAVGPGVITAIAPFPERFPRNRLGFARWLVSTNNPLVARVTVNRQWQAFFGKGLVKTADDFGFQGEAPSHPALLDWLAVDFMNKGWSMKALHKQIVMSATYQQSSKASPALLARDAENRLLARGPRGRLEAEIIRDGALRASGLLSEKRGGPSVYPPQPSGVTEVAYGGQGWAASEGADRHRRSVYTFAKRTAPFALYNTFDAPTGESCVARRDVSNTPLQALTLLNDVLFVEVAQGLGRMLLSREGSVDDRIRYGFRRCLTRPPTTDEVAALRAFLDRQRARLETRSDEAKQLAGEGSGNAAERAAWVALARVLLNLDEMITKG